MPACERCWSDATWLAAVKGGTPDEYYAEVLARNGPEHEPPKVQEPEPPPPERPVIA